MYSTLSVACLTHDTVHISKVAGDFLLYFLFCISTLAVLLVIKVHLFSH